MKTSKTVILALLLVLPVFTFASIDFDLKYGSKGAEVTELQEFLIDKGFLHSDATGNFYSLTKGAVMLYQSSENLPSTGFVGPMTREKINAMLAIDDSAEIQETGTVSTPVNTSPVSAIQKQIDDLGTILAQLIELQKNQTTQIQQTNQTLGAIQQNTAPIPVTVVSEPIPTEIVVNYSPSMLGGNCGEEHFETSIKYDNDKVKYGDVITMILDGVSQTETTGANHTYYEDLKSKFERLGNGSPSTNFKYSTSTTENLIIPVTFTSGSLSKTVNLKISPHIVPEYNFGNELSKNIDGSYSIRSTGQIYNPDTYQCK